MDLSSRFSPTIIRATRADSGFAAVVAMFVGTGIRRVRKSLAKGARSILPMEAVGTWVCELVRCIAGLNEDVL